nr:PREDICTED: uncharacterized protein LOC108213890 [Daucus carota subsp. sativus]
MGEHEELTKEMLDGELYEAHVSHPGHKLRFYSKAPDPNYECYGCKLPGDTNSYLRCPYENCSFYLHRVCYKFKPSHPPAWHKFFPHCEFLLYDGITAEVSDHSGDFSYCDACGEDIRGFRYRCRPDDDSHPQGNHDVHPTCFHRKDDITMNSGVRLELKDKVKSRCLLCKKRYPAEECVGFTGWKWVSEDREYWGFPYCFTGTKMCFHLKCLNEELRKQMK